MNKKILASLLVLLAAAIIFAGCSNSNTPGNTPGGGGDGDIDIEIFDGITVEELLSITGLWNVGELRSGEFLRVYFEDGYLQIIYDYQPIAPVFEEDIDCGEGFIEWKGETVVCWVYVKSGDDYLGVLMQDITLSGNTIAAIDSYLAIGEEGMESLSKLGIVAPEVLEVVIKSIGIGVEFLIKF